MSKHTKGQKNIQLLILRNIPNELDIIRYKIFKEGTRKNK